MMKINSIYKLVSPLSNSTSPVVTTLNTPISVGGIYHGHTNFLGRVEITWIRDLMSSLKSS